MPKQEVPLQALSRYLPEGCLDDIMHFLTLHKVHLTITKKRASILGDYRNANPLKNHRISVNGNLNTFSFLITLLHELAHLFTFEKFGHKVQAHGKEWKKEFSSLLSIFISKKVFPEDIEKALARSISNPAASSCGDIHLLRVLYRYDQKPEDVCLVESIPDNGLFAIQGNRIFKKIQKVRTRYKCMEVKTGKLYLFSGAYEVTTLSES